MGERERQQRAADMSTPLGAAAIASKTMFDAYVGAGFTEDQALKLTALSIAAAGGSKEN